MTNNWLPNEVDLEKDLDYYLNNMTENERKWFDYFCDKFGWDNPLKDADSGISDDHS